MARDTVFAVPTSLEQHEGQHDGKGRRDDDQEYRRGTRAGRPRSASVAPAPTAARRSARGSPRSPPTRQDLPRPRQRALDELAAGFRIRGGPHGADERERPAAIRDRANQVHDGVDETPGEVAAQCSDEHRPDFLAPASATDTAPTKVSAMNRPKSSSETRSTGLSTGSRTSFSIPLSPLIAIHSHSGPSIRAARIRREHSDVRPHRRATRRECAANGEPGWRDYNRQAFTQFARNVESYRTRATIRSSHDESAPDRRRDDPSPAPRHSASTSSPVSPPQRSCCPRPWRTRPWPDCPLPWVSTPPSSRWSSMRCSARRAC